MKVLAIETSCDETGVAIVEGQQTEAGFRFATQGAALLSQAELHAAYGGVYPNLAKREHQKNLPIILAQALGDSTTDDIDAVVVTSGPGLEPALWTGITFAQQLAKEWHKPLFAANHMEAHLISSLVQHGSLEHIQFPVLALLISGGHTEFVLMRDWFSYQVVGETLDDAVGEAFDKVARMLGLPYPGGPHISKLADAHRAKAGEPQAKGKAWPSGLERPESAARPLSLPRPMLNDQTCDVSFSGLKTAALYALRGKQLNDDEKAAFAAEFEDAVADVFVSKARRALNSTNAATFVIGGGVAANRYIRERLEQLVSDEFPDVEFRLPELSITGDNAIMIAQAALCHLISGDWKEPPVEIKAIGQLSIATP